MNESILVTGGMGFIGSHFIEELINDTKDYLVVNFDKLTYAANKNNDLAFRDHKNYTFVQGDICHSKQLDEVFSEYKVAHVIHFAAESHVDNSIEGPAVFMNTNCMGTFHLLDRARRFWAERSFSREPMFLHVSTDEVFGQLQPGDPPFTEQTPYDPSSPYSSSKAASDLMARSFHRTYGLNVIVTNCSNNFGPHQHHEKLIPTIIRSALKGQAIPIYGNGLNIRDWIYVKDHCKAIKVIFNQGSAGERYNIGGGVEKTNIDLAKIICHCLDQLSPRKDGKSYQSQISFVNDRPGHDFRYAISNEKIGRDFSWAPDPDFEGHLRKTVQWYIDHPDYLGHH